MVNLTSRPIGKNLTLSLEYFKRGYIYMYGAVQYRLIWKNLYSQNYSVFKTTRSRYSPLSATYFTQRLCHSSNTCWNSPMEIQDGDLRSLLPVRSRKNHRIWGLGCRECKESLPPNARSRNPEHAALCADSYYHDATSIDQYDNVVTHVGYAL